MMQALAGSVGKAGLVLSVGLAICGLALPGESQSRHAPTARHDAQNNTVCSTAAQSDIVIGTVTPGVTPFISSVQLNGTCVSSVVSVSFTIAPKPNTVSMPVYVVWDQTALANRGYVQTNTINLPVFGLYDGYQNQVRLKLKFPDSTVQTLSDSITTATYTGPPSTVLKSPTILQARAAGSTLGYSYLFLKSQFGSPVVVDTDGELRWIIPNSSALGGLSQYFQNGQFFVGSGSSQTITSAQMDGTLATVPATLPKPLLLSFSHNLDPGPWYPSIIGEFSGKDDIGASSDDIVAILSPESTPAVYNTYDMADILTSYMKANGDDPTLFVRAGVDWFHMNAATYDPNDDTIIVSGREDFVIKIQRTTKKIVWILGNPAGYWYTFPSLRAKALTLAAGGDYPIGQHGVSVTPEGYVMLFNDGEGSLNQPADNGISRTYSEVNAYSIDTNTLTAQQVWNFDANQSIFTNFCGSIYDVGNSYLIDFANEGANNNLSMRLIGLDSNHNVAFDFRYAQSGTCNTAWNAIPISFDNMLIQ